MEGVYRNYLGRINHWEEIRKCSLEYQRKKSEANKLLIARKKAIRDKLTKAIQIIKQSETNGIGLKALGNKLNVSPNTINIWLINCPEIYESDDGKLYHISVCELA